MEEEAAVALTIPALVAERIRVRHWDEVAFIILLMIMTVAAIDWVSGRLRRRLIGGRGAG